MTLPLTPDMLAAAYDFLRATPPFRGWKLPESDDVEFYVLTTHDRLGHYRAYHKRDADGCFGEIAISARRVGHSAPLIYRMSHEMVHLYQEVKRTTTPNTEHNAEFYRLAERVCRYHGFDLKDF